MRHQLNWIERWSTEPKVRDSNSLWRTTKKDRSLTCPFSWYTIQANSLRGKQVCRRSSICEANSCRGLPQPKAMGNGNIPYFFRIRKFTVDSRLRDTAIFLMAHQNQPKTLRFGLFFCLFTYVSSFLSAVLTSWVRTKCVFFYSYYTKRAKRQKRLVLTPVLTPVLT